MNPQNATPEESYWPQLISIIDAINSVRLLPPTRRTSIVITKLEEAELRIRESLLKD